MKKIAILLALFTFNFSLLTLSAAKPTPAQQLIQRLAKIQKKGYMYGHQDDPFYGVSWSYENGRSDTKDLVGDYPAVMGFDLGGIEMGDAKNLDSVPFQKIHDEVLAQYKRGGIITFSWHPRNPLIGTTAWIENDIKAYNQAVEGLKAIGQGELAKKIVNPQTTVTSVLAGGSQYDKFQTWLKRVADFLSTLKDSKGNVIPFIFRPWHEYNGNWFWWGQANCTAAEYKALWNMTQDYMNKRLPGVIVWSNSPNLSGSQTMERFLERWPGDDRVDLLGEDAYQWGTEADFKAQVDRDLKFMSEYGKAHNILVAMTECGYKNSPDATWWQRVFKPIIEKYPICYFLPWRNSPQEHFGCTKDATTAEDFKAWAKQKNFIFCKDIKGIK